ncbi:acyltransferase [Paenibacillus azoreducens]|uniref:Membrane protein n=1 Tax=Paenibacillus azoreducens TaxID=116718 RepID=A0A920CV92_9BACL|nr:acyltransferase family protein [Paenibacillus azoreducens]GIO51174.1 membrane protein [Paenibacillus azoreducens]
MDSVIPRKRILYVDCLRILSIIAVIMLHYTAELLTTSNDFNSASWWISNFFNSISRFAVPVFFMISGAMILRTEIGSYRAFFKKRVVPLLISLISWSFIYGLYNQYFILKSKMGAFEFLLDFGYRLLTDRNYVHLWFLYAIIAIYLTVPLVSKFLKSCSESDLRYYLLLWFIVNIAYRLVYDSVERLTGMQLSIPILNIPFFMGYLGYFILGYYLYHFDLPLKAKNILFNMGILSFFIAPVATYFVSVHSGVLDEMFYGNYSITTFFMAAGMFVYFKEKEDAMSAKVNHKLQMLIGSVSKASFSVYLIHLLIELIVSGGTEFQATVLEAALHLAVNISLIFIISYVTVKILNLNKAATYILFGGRG